MQNTCASRYAVRVYRKLCSLPRAFKPVQFTTTNPSPISELTSSLKAVHKEILRCGRSERLKTAAAKKKQPRITSAW